MLLYQWTVTEESRWNRRRGDPLFSLPLQVYIVSFLDCCCFLFCLHVHIKIVCNQKSKL